MDQDPLSAQSSLTTIQQCEFAFALYQDESPAIRINTIYTDVNYRSIRQVIYLLSLLNYRIFSSDFLLDPNDIRINPAKASLPVFTFGDNYFYDYKNTERVNELIKSLTSNQKEIILRNVNVINKLDYGLIFHDSLYRSHDTILQKVSDRTTRYLYKGIKDINIPRQLLDDAGIIKDFSEFIIGGYTSTTTNLILSLEFTKDSTPGHLFLIHTIGPGINAFDYANFLVNGIKNKQAYRYPTQYGYIEEQEILFKRYLKIENIKYIGLIKDVEVDESKYKDKLDNLQDKEFLLCGNNCLYMLSNKICSSKILSFNGIVNNTPIRDITELAMYINVKIYSCHIQDPNYEFVGHGGYRGAGKEIPVIYELDEKPKIKKGGMKMLKKIDIINNIIKIIPDIKGLTKLNKNKLNELYNYICKLNKCKKIELINNHKNLKLNTKMKKCDIIHFIVKLKK